MISRGWTTRKTNQISPKYHSYCEGLDLSMVPPVEYMALIAARCGSWILRAKVFQPWII